MTDHSDYFGPEGLLVRGTVIVVPGRGETQGTYTRFGKRLAADAYRVRVVDAPVLEQAYPDASLTAFASRLADAVEGTAPEDGVARPVVLVGADSGAAAVAALLGRADVPAALRPDAVVLAGLPGRAAYAGATWDDELDVRTSCPTHRGALTRDPEVRRGTLADAVPDAVLTALDEGAVDIPVLLLAGGADPLADHEALERAAKSLSRARLSVVHGAHHDVLNDLQHRSVAAEVVSFLETLRNELRPLISVRSSAW
ncbi:alpha/beta hydrolase [Streptomyces phaeolivaceus]|uniref:Alpha/beta hydrolase n=1 Tax=Streptomyces phaeolivaceus TaxID=2653200 RepID=A0A5P8KH25_9ACTN|nr:alpha/beta fold hydrolase [Streptomyces phaeolivaceus]QFR02291.1 alpha/beta hydrolase [Streptomyces phaeolivaceus]